MDNLKPDTPTSLRGATDKKQQDLGNVNRTSLVRVHEVRQQEGDSFRRVAERGMG